MKKIAITDDRRILRCRLFIQLIEMCNAKPVLIPVYLKPSSVVRKGTTTSKKNLVNTEQFKESLNNHLQKVAKLLEECDGLILPGNKRDVPPSAYGVKKIHPETAKRMPENPLNVRFETEKFMLEFAMKEKPMPAIGACGGFQVANTVLGGTLVQHLPDDKRTISSGITHSDPTLKKLPKNLQEAFEQNFKSHINKNTPKNIFPKTHPMEVEPASHLAKIYTQSNPKTDLKSIYELSIHHQGCFRENLSPLLMPVCYAPDGVVEAIEMPTYPHMFLFTQFHFECNVSGIAKRMIQGLVNDEKHYF